MGEYFTDEEIEGQVRDAAAYLAAAIIAAATNNSNPVPLTERHSDSEITPGTAHTLLDPQEADLLAHTLAAATALHRAGTMYAEPLTPYEGTDD